MAFSLNGTQVHKLFELSETFPNLKIIDFSNCCSRKGNSLVGAEEKDIFDKMKKLNMSAFYLPKMILYHIIPAVKLTSEYLIKLSYSIGKSERMRTLAISKSKYFKRLIMESIKWTASILLLFIFLIKFQPQKGTKLIIFRWNVTKGLFF